MATLACPRCNQPFECPDSLAGQVVQCPHCQGQVATPQLPPVRDSQPPIAPQSSVANRIRKRKQSASPLLWIIGSLGLLFFLCCGGLIATTPQRKAALREAHEQKMQELDESIRQAEATISQIEAEKARADAMLAELRESAWFKDMQEDAARGISPGNIRDIMSQRYPDEEPFSRAYIALQAEIVAVIHEAHSNQPVYGLIESERKSLAAQVLRLEDTYGYDTPEYNRRRSELEARYGLSRDQVNEIMGEAIEKNWNIGW